MPPLDTHTKSGALLAAWMFSNSVVADFSLDLVPDTELHGMTSELGGSGNDILLTQDGRDNHAIITQVQAGSSYAGNVLTLSQTGTGNYASLLQHGYLNTAQLSQNGEANTIGLSQTGIENYAGVTQVGNSNHTDITQVGIGLSVIVTQYGDNNAAYVLQQN